MSNKSIEELLTVNPNISFQATLLTGSTAYLSREFDSAVLEALRSLSNIFTDQTARAAVTMKVDPELVEMFLETINLLPEVIRRFVAAKHPSSADSVGLLAGYAFAVSLVQLVPDLAGPLKPVSDDLKKISETKMFVMVVEDSEAQAGESNQREQGTAIPIADVLKDAVVTAFPSEPISVKKTAPKLDETIATATDAEGITSNSPQQDEKAQPEPGVKEMQKEEPKKQEDQCSCDGCVMNRFVESFKYSDFVKNKSDQTHKGLVHALGIEDLMSFLDRISKTKPAKRAPAIGCDPDNNGLTAFLKRLGLDPKDFIDPVYNTSGWQDSAFIARKKQIDSLISGMHGQSFARSVPTSYGGVPDRFTSLSSHHRIGPEFVISETKSKSEFQKFADSQGVVLVRERKKIAYQNLVGKINKQIAKIDLLFNQSNERTPRPDYLIQTMDITTGKYSAYKELHAFQFSLYRRGGQITAPKQRFVTSTDVYDWIADNLTPTIESQMRDLLAVLKGYHTSRS